MSQKHVCIYGQECWCGAPVENRNASDGRRSFVAGVTGQAGWPIYSDGAGVLPSQIPEAQEQLRKAGLRDDCFTPAGRMKFENAAHRRACLKAISKYGPVEMFDRSSFS